MSEEKDDEIEDYDELRKRLKSLEAQLGQRAWGGASGGGGGASTYGANLDPQAEVEKIYQKLREGTMTQYDEKMLRHYRLGPMFDRIARDLVGNT